MDEFLINTVCQTERENASEHRKVLPKAINTVLGSMEDETCFAHIGDEPIHFSTSVKEMIDKFREVLSPGIFQRKKSMGPTWSITWDRSFPNCMILYRSRSSMFSGMTA